METEAVVVGAQEHHIVDTDKLEERALFLDRRSWETIWSSARRSYTDGRPKGRFAGTMLACKKGKGSIKQVEVQWVGEATPHRLTMGVLRVAGMPDIIAGSCYLQDCVGMTDYNCGIMASAFATAGKANLPLLLMGDYNVTPVRMMNAGKHDHRAHRDEHLCHQPVPLGD